ncbi:MAG: SHOCT domain-containing protein [Trueperaceae bacterium]|nr:SHOCT domain-containing protein [Trueperaceae bacterium]
MWQYMDGVHMGAWGSITALLVWALIVLGIVYLWRTLHLGQALQGRRVDRAAQGDPALEILRERYAKGDIDGDEFERRKRDLS